MTMHQARPIRPLWAALALSAAMGASPALAADKNAPADAQARYLRDTAACRTAPAKTDQTACLREAGAARGNKEHAGVEPDSGRFARNALKRCEPLPPSERRDCVARMQGEGTTSGSVAGGGILRELVTREVAPPVTRPVAEPAASAPR